MLTEAQVEGLGQFAQWGFTLAQDDHILLLLHQGKLVTRFSQAGATQETLQAECSKHLVIKHGWDGCLWSKGEVMLTVSSQTRRG